VIGSGYALQPQLIFHRDKEQPQRLQRVLVEVGRVNNLGKARYGQEHSHADSGADRYSSAHPHLPELRKHLSAKLAHCCC
jgi:hypothetical protein